VKCPDCNGGIEGAPPFCPHCGRTLEDGLVAVRGLLSRSRQGQFRQEEQAAAPPSLLRPLKGAGEENQGRRPPLLLPPSPIRIVAIIAAGALVGYILPGKPWMTGAIIGLFLALPKKKKS